MQAHPNEIILPLKFLVTRGPDGKEGAPVSEHNENRPSLWGS